MTNIVQLAQFQESAAAVSVAVTAASQRTALTRVSSDTRCNLLVSIVGADPVAIKLLSADSGSATMADRLFIGNSQQVIPLPAGITHAALISTGTASTAYLQEGNGA